MTGLAERIAELNDELIALRRDFHAHPEIGYGEHRTAGIVEEYLRDLGMDPQRVSGTGVTAVLEGGSSEGPVLLMRADLDALPIAEDTGLEFASQNSGVMHACGHDAHISMMLITAKVLSGMRDHIKGKVKFCFQPNEEITGAEQMIQDGVLEHPTVDAAMGVHIWTPLKSGTIGVKAGAVTSSMEVFKVTVKGYGGHTGYPESAVDPVLAASAVVQSVQQVQTRKLSLMKPTVIMFGRISGGTKSNIIPDSVELEGTIRYLYRAEPGSREHPLTLFKETVERTCEAYGCTAVIDSYHENDATVNDEQMAALARSVAAEVVGEQQVTEHASMACEDFAAFGQRVPAVFSFIGTANEAAKSSFPHHNPKFTIDEGTLPIGVEFLVRSALRYFAETGI